MTEEEKQEVDVAPEVTDEPEVVDSPDDFQDRVLMELDPVPDDDDLEPYQGEESEPEGDAGGTEPGETEDDSSPLSDEVDMDDVYDVLRRDGWSDDDFENFTAERLTELAEHRKQMQADVDRKLRGDSEEPDAPAAETDSDADAEPASDLPDTPVSDAVEYLSDYLGLDEQGKDLLSKFQTASIKPMQEAVEQQAALLQQMQTAMLRQEIDRSRDALRGEYADIVGEDANFQRVLQRMDKLAKDSEEDRSVGELMEEALLLEFKGEITDKVKETKKSVRHLKDSGQPSVRPKQPKPQRQYSQEEREDAVLKILESDDPDKFKRARALGRN